MTKNANLFGRIGIGACEVLRRPQRMPKAQFKKTHKKNNCKFEKTPKSHEIKRGIHDLPEKQN